MSRSKINNPAYRIETDRLVIRCYQPSDLNLLANSIHENIEHLKPWMPWAHFEPTSLDEKLSRLVRFRGLFDTHQDCIYGIFNKDESVLVGGTGLHPRLGEQELEIGYWIHKDYINQGLVTESTSSLIQVAFEVLHTHRIEIHCHPSNYASAAIPRKLGFTHEGTLREKNAFLDGWHDSMIWGLLDSEYPESPASKFKIKVYNANGSIIL